MKPVSLNQVAEKDIEVYSGVDITHSLKVRALVRRKICLDGYSLPSCWARNTLQLEIEDKLS